MHSPVSSSPPSGLDDLASLQCRCVQPVGAGAGRVPDASGDDQGDCGEHRPRTQRRVMPAPRLAHVAADIRDRVEPVRPPSP